MVQEKNLNIKILAGEVLGQSSSVNTYSPVSIFDTQFHESNELNLYIPKELFEIKGILDAVTQPLNNVVDT